MRLLVISDIHLEFAPWRLPEDLPDFDVAVFAGDIDKPLMGSLRWIDYEMKHGPLLGKEVIFVPGNHEFYGATIPQQLEWGRDFAREIGVRLLAPGCAVIGDTRFIGAILWTNYALLGDANAGRAAAGRAMNDHRLIGVDDGDDGRRFTPSDAASLHHEDLAYLTARMEEPFEGQTVVVTHHAPHPGSVQPRYRGDSLSPAFASDLTEVIERYEPALWIHGHDHGSHDYMVGATRILSNQAGYPTPNSKRENPAFDPRLVVEVPPAPALVP
jgi:3',5'-cyclic AMP phosphodiesterase CpdA